MNSQDNFDDATPSAESFNESNWVEVIQKMDEVYNELLQYEVALEQKNAALEESQQFIFSVLTSMSDLLLVCDCRGVIEEVNQALLTFTGLGEYEIKGQKLATLFAREDASNIVDRVMTRLSVEPTYDLELEFSTKGGGESMVALNFTARLSGQGKLLGVVVTGRPVGELRRAYHALRETHDQLKRTQQQLLQSEKMASLGRLVAGVAHELNNPISFVLGNVHAMRRYADRLQQYLEAVHAERATPALLALRNELRIDRILDDLTPLIDGTVEGAERTRHIVDGLKRFSAVDRNENIVFNLTEILERSVHWVTKATNPNFKVAIEAEPELYLIGSPSQMQQVIINIVQNSADATDQQAQQQMCILAWQEGEYVYAVFSDNGPGISQETMDKIFDPFFTTKPVGKGTGLGLSISYGIIERHGGTFSVANGALGGAEFTLCLPAAKSGN